MPDITQNEPKEIDLWLQYLHFNYYTREDMSDSGTMKHIISEFDEWLMRREEQ